jgi:AcrR family transcriptional regulator
MPTAPVSSHPATSGPRRRDPEATRSALVAAARELFTERGYHDTSTEEIVARSGVGTRGALYHHFADKRALFEAVHEAVHADLLAAVRSNQSGDPANQLRAGLDTYLDASLTPEVQRILLVDGPAVLGRSSWPELKDHYTIRDITGFLSDAADAGVVPRSSLLAISAMLLAASEAAAQFIANSDDPRQARAEVADALDALLRGFDGPSSG